MTTESSESQGYDALAPSQALGSRTNKKRNHRKKGPPSNNGHAEGASHEGGISDPPAAVTTAEASKKKPPNQNGQKGNETRGGNRQPEVIASGPMPTAPNTADPSFSSASQQASSQAQQGRKKSAKLRNGRGQKTPINNERGAVETRDESVSDQPKQQQQQQRNQSKKKKNTRKRYPWRKFVPSGTVDPITLESLISLEYPPFALVANAPYDPVPVWPIPEGGGDSDQQSLLQPPAIDIEELNRRRIAEQWGTSLTGEGGGGGETEASKMPTEQVAADPSNRHYNLYDGRALAYYIVSQLQFIDPLNRRDLTRPELLNLDVYLRRHGFQDLNVTDAYDAKGVTISSAGAAATTAQGRADIMQQLARNLLNSLFGGQSVSATPRPTQPSSLQQQYAALQIQEQQQQQQRPRQQGRNGGQQQQQHPQQPGYSTLNPEAASFDSGFYYSEDGGIVVIDDDENLGMRGGDYSVSRGNNQGNGFAGRGSSTNPFYSASHIAARYGSGFVSGSSADAFPELPTPVAVRTNQTAESAAQTAKGGQTTARSAPKPSKTLARITGAVKKTSPEEELKQWKAREEARKRAMMGSMSFGVDTAAIGYVQQSVLMPPPGLSTGLSTADVSEEKLQRNKAFADALGVKPATLRQNLNSGWARPTGTSITLDDFGNELNAAIYPDALLAQARDRTSLVLKIEKKWKAFLVDDKAASLPLYPMDRATRIFVHQYSDFWNLKTESFDPEPRRYIHCVKLPETHMPRPLLSDAARMWRGPSAVPTVSLADLPRGPSASLAHSQQTAGEPSKSREIPPPPERVPLPLQPRTLALGEQKEDSRSLGVLDVNDHDGDILASGRFTSLSEGRERPKISLAKRTVPLDLPSYQLQAMESNSDAEIQQRRARLTEIERRKKETEERKRRALEDVFASDDEDDETADAASAGSAWEEPEAVYQGSDSEH